MTRRVAEVTRHLPEVTRHVADMTSRLPDMTRLSHFESLVTEHYSVGSMRRIAYRALLVTGYFVNKNLAIPCGRLWGFLS